jgi:general secretion pathway protein D
MKYLLIGLTLLSLSLGTALAAKKTKINVLKDYVEKVSKLTGVQYVYPKKLEGDIGLSKNFKLTKDNADSFLSYILSVNGYTRITESKKTFHIVPSRDVRYTPTKMYLANKNLFPNIPNNHDYALMTYDLKNKGFEENIVRSIRPFMSRYGRIISMKQLGNILIQDTGKNLRRVYQLIKNVDRGSASK